MNKRENLTPYGDENVHLLYAYSGIDKDKLVSIEDTFEENSNLFCPLCGEAVFPRKGNHNRHSFAHKSGSCFPNSVMEDNFIINLALKKFYEVERIKTPARVYRLNKNGKNVLELKESPEVIRVKPDIKLDKIEGHQGLLGLALAKTYAGEPIAVLFLRKAEPYNSTIFQLMKEGYSVLSVNLENIQMPNSLDKILEFLIIENDKSKEWLSNLPYPDSLTYLERVLPKNALISKEENTQCQENSCSDCEFAVKSIDNKELCLKNWTLNEWTRYHLEPTPDYIHKMDEYLEILEKLKNRISNTDSAWKSITNSLKILTPNLANKKSSDTLFEAGEIQESLNGEKGKFLIRWGFNSKTIVIFIEPIDNTDKDVPVYLFKIIKKVDYFNRRTLHDIRIFKSENKENLFNKIFYDLNTLLTDSPSWREINLRGNRALLKNYCFQLEQLLNKLQPIKVVKAERFLDEAYELLNRNSRFYKEDQNRILSPSEFCFTYFNEQEDKGGLLAFGITGLKEKFGSSYYGAQWELPLNIDRPIEFYKFENLDSFLDKTLKEEQPFFQEKESSSEKVKKALEYFKDQFDITKWVPYEEEPKSALLPERLSLTVLGKIVLNSDINLAALWKMIDQKELLSEKRNSQILRQQN